MKYKVLTICLGLHFFLLSGQDIRPYDLEKQAQHAEKTGYNSLYRVNYFENIIVKSFINSDVANFQYRSLDNKRTFDLAPASENLSGISLDYKWIAIEAAYSLPFLQITDNVSDIEGSKSFNLKINFFFSDRWRQELSYLYLKGFINKDSQTSQNELLRVLNNTTLRMFQGSTFFIENENFSFRSHYAQTERQLKSAGSLIPKLSYSLSITEPNLNTSIDAINTVKLTSFDVIGQVGYLYTFVANKKWFATVGLHPGVGYNNANYSNTDNSIRRFNSVVFAFDSEISLGYNSYRWFFGVNGNWRNYNNLNNENGQTSRDSEYFMVYLGYRFNDNKLMRKFFGWFEDHLGF